MKAGSLFVGLAALTLAAPALAQNVVADREQIASVLRGAGYKAEILGEPGSNRYISTGTGGNAFTIHMYGCNEDSESCKTVMFYAWFDDDPPSLEAMNQYSSSHRWGRFYIDEDGDAVIEMDLDLEDGGVAPELFIDNIEYWDAVLSNYAQFVRTGTVPEG